MVIKIAEDNDLPNMEFMEESSSYTFRDLMDKVYAEGDLIITVPESEAEALRQGLIVRKSKDNKQAKAKGILPHPGVLSFLTYAARDKDDKEIIGQVCVRVSLGERKSINVISMEVPTNDL